MTNKTIKYIKCLTTDQVEVYLKSDEITSIKVLENFDNPQKSSDSMGSWLTCIVRIRVICAGIIYDLKATPKQIIKAINPYDDLKSTIIEVQTND